MQPLASDSTPDKVLHRGVVGKVPGVSVEKGRHTIGPPELCTLLSDQGQQGLLGDPLHSQLLDILLQPKDS